MPRPRRFGLLLAALLVAVLGWNGARAADVLLVLSEDSAAYREFADAFLQEINRGPGRPAEVRVASLASPPAWHDASLIVAVGTRAGEFQLRAAAERPALHALLPQAAHARIVRDAGNAVPAALVLDQPPARLMRFIRLALPAAKRAGMLFGPESILQRPAMEKAAREAGLEMAAENIAAERDLFPALQRVLRDADVVLAVPDALVYNATTVQGILLTAYQSGDPLVAFSAGYVRAGAVAALYSSPAQQGREAAELVREFRRSGRLRALQFPRYFSVAINEDVARSLGIALPQAEQLRERLQRAEAAP